METRRLCVGLALSVALQLPAWAGPYEQCIKDNLEKAKTEAAVKLLKETCEKEAEQAKSACKSKKPAELPDEELCKCLGLAYDAASKKCK